METTKSVGIWIRVSTEDQALGDSPEHHEKRARLYAEAKDWDVVTVYHLEAISGKTVMQHPEAQRMLRDIQSGAITGLIFSKLARLARNVRELLDFADIFQAAGADLISLQESIDTSTPAGRLFYTMIAAMAQWEREEIAARVSASVPIRAKLGKPLGGAAPFGYTWQGEEGQAKELVINEQEAPIRKLMYELFLKHRRKGTVADELNERGHRTRNGSLFTDTTIGRLLADPIAKGERRANYSKSLGEGKSWQLKPESEWVILPAPPIVSKQLWDDCYLILSEQEQKNARPARKTVHIFTGMLFCECGHKMYLPSKSKKYRCYNCGKAKISTEDIEEIYYENLKSFLMTGEHIKTFVARADEMIAAKEKEIVHLREKRKLVEEKMENLMQLHYKKEIPSEGFKRHYSPLQEQYDQIHNALPELQGEVDYLKIERLNGNHVFEQAQNMADRWPTLSTEGKRTTVEQVTKKIIIGEEDILIKFNYTPSSNPQVGAVVLPIVLSATSPKYPKLPTQPCPCGFYNHPDKDCVCGPGVVQKYLNKISGPLLDRIDLHVEVTPLPISDLSGEQVSEKSDEIRLRVIAAREIQEKRFAGQEGVHCNAQISSNGLKEYCVIGEAGKTLLNRAMERLGLSARAYDRILKVARTIADLSDSPEIKIEHLAEAIQFRSLDRDSWAN